MDDTQQTPPSPDSNSFMRGLAERLGTVTIGPTMDMPVPAPQAPTSYEDPDLQAALEAQQKFEAAKPTAGVEVSAEPEVEEPIKTTNKKGLDAFSDETAEEEKVEAAPAEEEEPPAGVRTKEARDAWKKMREGSKRAAQLEKELAETRKQLESAGKITDADPVKKENEALKKEIEELRPVIARVAYQKSAAYQETIGKPMQRIGADAQAIAKQYEIPDEKMMAALMETDRRRQAELIDEIGESMNGLDKSEVYTMANQLRRLYAMDDEMAANAVTAQREAEALEAAERSKTATERKAAEMRAVAELKPKLTGIAKTLISEGQTTDDYVSGVIHDANAVPFDEHAPEDKAYLAVAGRLLKDLAPAYKNALAKITALEKKIGGMSAASPRTASGAPAQQGSGSSSPDFMTRLGERLRNAGVQGL